MATDIRAIFNAANLHDAEALLAKTVQKYADSASSLASGMEENIPQGLTVFAFPQLHHRRLRTTNGLERLNREIRRRSRIAAIFPNEASCLRLVTALVMETSEEWVTGRAYLRFDLDSCCKGANVGSCSRSSGCGYVGNLELVESYPHIHQPLDFVRQFSRDAFYRKIFALS